MPELIAFDLETHLIEPGNLTPKPVCVSYYGNGLSGVETFPEGWSFIEGLFRDGLVIAGANVAFDFGVICAYRPDLIPEVFRKYERGEVHDVLVAAALDAIADGRMGEHGYTTRTGELLREKGDEGPLARRFSLQNTTWLYTGRKDAKDNDEYRLRYAELDGVPLADWPEVARDYPLDDARNTYDVAVAQRAAAKNLGLITGRDWTELTHHGRAAFAMHLGSVWGLRTDAAKVQVLEEEVNLLAHAALQKFSKLGLIREDGKDNRSEVKRLVLASFSVGELPKCTECKGTFKVLSEKTGKPVNCKACDSTGLQIPPTVPRTPAGGIAADRDTLLETGNELLVEWAKAGLHEKMQQTYLPWLKQGTEAPLNVRPNVLIATGRASYDGLIQLIPPKAREAIIPAEGFVFCSVDYAALELCTLAQVCKSVVGHSKMADTINASRDPGSLHTYFAAQMAGINTSDDVAMQGFKTEAKDKLSKAASLRQMAKAANFGFPGLMGPATFVLAKRREGLRLCVTAGLRTSCAPGVLKYDGRELKAPTCPVCLDVATKLRKDWFAMWPEIQEYFAWVQRVPRLKEGQGTLRSPLTGFVRGGLSASNAANHSFQHLAAMGAKHALWALTLEAHTDESSPLYGAHFPCFIHDEVFAELPEEVGHEAGWRMSEVMVSKMREFVPDVFISAEPTLMRRWYKKATLTVDASGRMIPWTP